MKNLFALAAAMVIATCGRAQTLVKPFDVPLQDSITYQVQTAVFIINKQDVEDYFTGLDTVLVQRKYAKEVFRNIQFAHLSSEEVQRHYGIARKFWSSSKGNPLSYSTDRIALFWSENENVLLPYLDEILPELLEFGKVQVVDRSTGKRVPQYHLDYENVDTRSFKIFKFVKGRIIWRESEVFLEQLTNAGI
jgi:hypothetical protein